MKPDQIKDKLLHGECYATSIVLAEELDLSIGALLVDVPMPMADGWRVHPVHAFVILPNGVFFDANGETDEDDLTERYLAHTSRKFRNPRIVKFINAVNFRDELRCLERGEAVAPGQRTSFDDYLDDRLPTIRQYVEQLDLTNEARASYPSLSL